MGIPRFFYYIYNNYPKCLYRLYQNQTTKNLKVNIDTLAIDLNALIHTVCNNLFNNDKLLSKVIIQNDKQIFNRVCNEINNLVKLTSPSKELFIAIDGVPGLSKQNQQRQRRFKSSLLESSFDRNKITTGTLFMHNFSYYLHNYINKMVSKEWSHLRVIFSNEKVAGEGEHKIIRYINNNDSVCIYSPDADLILLTAPFNNIKILRENIYKNLDNSLYFIIDIDIYKEYLYNDLSTKNNNDMKKIINDFILLSFMFGNDFIPNIQGVEIMYNGIDIFKNLYKELSLNYVNDDLSLNTQNLYLFLCELEKLEYNLFLKKVESQDKITFKDETLLKFSKDEVFVNEKEEKLIKTKLDLENYKKYIYQNKIKNSDIKYLCNYYFKTLVYIIKYYLQEIPDWNYSYNYHYAPFISDLKNYIKDFNDYNFNKNKPLDNIEQLMCVLPPKSKELLPEACRKYLDDKKSPVKDLYPDNFEIDLEGKRQEWEGHIILPFIELDRIRNCYKECIKDFNDIEKKINIKGKVIYYKNINGRVNTFYE